jgi:hypothetical protein
MIFLMLVFVAIMTYTIMVKPDSHHPEKEEPQTQAADKAQPDGLKTKKRDRSFRRWRTFSHNLSTGVGEHPFWAIMLFMALFLGVSYLFGFAFAFHDQNTRAQTKGEAKGEMPALHMVNLNSIDDVHRPSKANEQHKEGESSKSGNAQTAQSPASPSDGNVASLNLEQEEFCFYFEELKASISQNREGCPSSYPNPKRMDLHPQIQIFNSCSLNAIADRLKQETDNGRRVKVALLGHTDNEPIKAPSLTSVRYLSNYELSESRAQNVQYAILQKLRDKAARSLDNIKWVVFPAADEALLQINRGTIREDMFRPDELKNIGITPNSLDRNVFVDQIQKILSTETIDKKLPPQEKRVVIATIEPISESPVVLQTDQFRNLTTGQRDALDKLNILESAQSEHIAQSQSKNMRLMDYMYFSIYTITTTGYGDIIPTTAYAKFLASVANIFEVIFLVVFFNALISLKKSPDDDSADKQSPSGPLRGEKETLDESVLGNPTLSLSTERRFRRRFRKGRLHY